MAFYGKLNVIYGRWVMNFIQKLKRSIFGEQKADDKAYAVVKDKKLTPKEKYCTILEIYSNYLNTEFESDLKMKVYELYYEQFMINNQKDENRYSQIYGYEKENDYYLHCIQFIKQISSIKDLKVEDLTNQQTEILRFALLLKKNIYTPSFNYESFYFSKNLREAVKQQNEKLMQLIKDYGKSKDPSDLKR